MCLHTHGCTCFLLYISCIFLNVHFFSPSTLVAWCWFSNVIFSLLLFFPFFFICRQTMCLNMFYVSLLFIISIVWLQFRKWWDVCESAENGAQAQAYIQSVALPFFYGLFFLSSWRSMHMHTLCADIRNIIRKGNCIGKDYETKCNYIRIYTKVRSQPSTNSDKIYTEIAISNSYKTVTHLTHT